MNPLTRRNALRAIGLGAPAAGFFAEKFKRDMAINPGISALGGGAAEPPGDGPIKFTSFADWFKRIGHEDLKKQARHISGFDGDLIDMHLPMVTKIRMQRARNYAHLLEEKKNWFAERLSAHGMVNWWP